MSLFFFSSSSTALLASSTLNEACLLCRLSVEYSLFLPQKKRKRAVIFQKTPSPPLCPCLLSLSAKLRLIGFTLHIIRADISHTRISYVAAYGVCKFRTKKGTPGSYCPWPGFSATTTQTGLPNTGPLRALQADATPALRRASTNDRGILPSELCCKVGRRCNVLKQQQKGKRGISS